MDFIVLDLETTGLNSGDDEILQIAIIDDLGKTLLNTYVKPVHHDSWDSAQSVHGISPESVKNAPTLDELYPTLIKIFNSCDKIVGYNIDFDLSFLVGAGFDFSQHDVVCVMRAFAPIYGEWNYKYENYKWQTLSTCAQYYNYQFCAHDALNDVHATLYCYNKIFVYQNH